MVDNLDKIAALAEQSRELVENGDLSELNKLINRNFDLRRKIMNISESNLELVATARKCGASAKFSGSGGAIIGLYKDREMLTHLIVKMKKINARVIKPFIL